MFTPKRIAVGSDHAALEVKARLIEYLREKGWEVDDFTVISSDGRADYPVSGHRVAEEVASGRYPVGLLFCATGIGISIAANRHKGVRAALCLSKEYAKATRDHNDANILVMPGRATIYDKPEEILDVFLNTGFSHGERHVKRIAMIDDPNLK